MTPLRAPWSLRQLVDDLRAGRTTSAEAFARSRSRIQATEPELRAWVSHRGATGATPDAAPLVGVPLGVKDIIDVAGIATRCGSAVLADAPPAAADAAIVSAWREAGAIPVGKTVTTEYAYFAPGPTQNPSALGHTPGGSSSGSAAAVASGQVPLALGSQTAGSVTRPASYCGVASLVMSHGRLATDGVTGLSPSLDSHGFFAATVSDLAVAWSALTGEADAGIDEHPEPLHVLVWHGSDVADIDPEMQDALAAVVDGLRSSGATVETFPDGELVVEVAGAQPVIMAYEAARERSELLDAAISPQLAALLHAGAATTDAAYGDARARVAAAAVRLGVLLDGYDVILAPAAPGPAPAGIDATGDPVLSRPWQALGVPVATVPGMHAPDGRPLGLQVIGRPNREFDLLRHARRLESTLLASVTDKPIRSRG